MDIFYLLIFVALSLFPYFLAGPCTWRSHPRDSVLQQGTVHTCQETESWFHFNTRSCILSSLHIATNPLIDFVAYHFYSLLLIDLHFFLLFFFSFFFFLSFFLFFLNFSHFPHLIDTFISLQVLEENGEIVPSGPDPQRPQNHKKGSGEE